MTRTEYRAPVDADFDAMLRGKGTMSQNMRSAFLWFGALAILVNAVFESYVAAVAVGCALFMAALWSNVLFFRQVNARRQLMHDDRAVEVIQFSATRILDIEAPGSTGPALVFFDGTAEALLVVGQWTMDFAPFPVAEFNIHRWTDTKEPIRVEGIGAVVLPEESPVVLRTDYSYGKVEHLRATPSTLQSDLDIAFGGNEA